MRKLRHRDRRVLMESRPEQLVKAQTRKSTVGSNQTLKLDLTGLSRGLGMCVEREESRMTPELCGEQLEFIFWMKEREKLV